MVDEADFAALVFGPDDKVMSRKIEEMAPRDNVVFELGLFMGDLKRERTFIVKEHKADIKIPSDLLGLTPITYVHHEPAPLASAVGPVALDIMKRVQALGVR
jgi:CRP/FNR family cyclic AMP-dependent transcriptional regulator